MRDRSMSHLSQIRIVFEDKNWVSCIFDIFDLQSCFKIALILVTLRTSSVTFVILIAGLCVVTLLGLLLLVWRVKVQGRKQRLKVILNFDGS